MALRAAALVAVGSVAGATASSACPDSTNPMISMVTDISPACFEQCPKVCRPLDALVTEYLATSDVAAIKTQVCAAPAPFSCLFEADHAETCGKVLAAGAAFGVELPTSAAQLQEQCGGGSSSSGSNLRGGGDKYQDTKPEEAADNSTNGTNGTNATGDDAANDTNATGGGAGGDGDAETGDGNPKAGGSQNNSNATPGDISAAEGRGFLGAAAAPLLGFLASAVMAAP